MAAVGDYINEQGEMVPIDNTYPNRFPYEDYQPREDGTMIKMTNEEKLEKTKKNIEFMKTNGDRIQEAERMAWYVINQKLNHRTDVTQQDKEELANEVLKRVVTNIDKYDAQKAKFSTWVSTITTNRIIELINKLERKQTKYPGFPHFENFDDETFIGEQYQPQGIEKQEKLNQIQEAIDQLSEEERIFIEDKLYNKKTFAQMQEEYSMTEQQTKNYYQKIMKKLKKIVENSPQY